MFTCSLGRVGKSRLFRKVSISDWLGSWSEEYRLVKFCCSRFARYLLDLLPYWKFSYFRCWIRNCVFLCIMLSSWVLIWLNLFCIGLLGLLVYWLVRCLILCSNGFSSSCCCFFLYDEYDMILWSLYWNHVCTLHKDTIVRFVLKSQEPLNCFANAVLLSRRCKTIVIYLPFQLLKSQVSSAIMNKVTGFSAHLCDVVQKPRRRQKPIVTILLSELSYDAFKSYFCDHTHLG